MQKDCEGLAWDDRRGTGFEAPERGMKPGEGLLDAFHTDVQLVVV